MDFTFKNYAVLISVMKQKGYWSQTFENFLKTPKMRSVIFRHDVDRLPVNALRMAEIEAEMGVKASYYFRIVKESFNENIMKKIAGMGHEIGYHYENLSAVARDQKQEVRSQKTGRTAPAISVQHSAVFYKIPDPKSQIQKFYLNWQLKTSK